MGLFNHTKLNPKGQLRVDRVQGGFEQLEKMLSEFCPPGRELSLVKTKLQEACFWAKKGISITPENQDEE